MNDNESTQDDVKDQSVNQTCALQIRQPININKVQISGFK